MPMLYSNQSAVKKKTNMRKKVIGEMLKLATSGFGLVAALAWNELIKEIIKEYVKPLFGESSGLISLLIYATAVTVLAVMITYNLTKLLNKKKD